MAVQLVQVRSGVYQLDLACISSQASASQIWYISVVRMVQVRSSVYQLSGLCKLDPVCISCPPGAS